VREAWQLIAPIIITNMISNPFNFFIGAPSAAKKGGRSPREKGPGLAVWGEERFFKSAL
jgi:hypothetical protein